MKQLSKIRLKYIGSLLLTFLFINQGFGQESKPEVVDEIVAKVDDHIILLSDIEYSYLDMASRGALVGSSPRCQILQSLITSKMLLAIAEVDSVEVTDEEVESQLERRMQYFIAQSGGSADALEEYYGKPLADIRSEMRDDMHDQMVAQKMKDKISEDVTITPSEVKKFFNRIPKDSLPYFSEEVEVSQIVKIAKIGKDQKKQVQAKLFDIKRQIENGADFGELAKKYSMDPGSARTGGELPGWYKRGELAPEYEAACFQMNVGEISDPIETDFGFHLIQLLERRGNEFRSRHILIIPSSSDLDISLAEHELDSIRTQVIDGKIDFERAAKDLSDDKFSAPSGGYFLDDFGSTRISVDQLDPTVYFMLDTMQVGSISKPVTFRMADGKEAVRIIYYKARYEPHQADLKVDWQKIQMAALNEKKGRAEVQWVKDSKDRVYIYVNDDFKKCNILEE
ncbi:MAG: peptidylprolyl isomerase [Cyclobacteriaceae bacterium]|nr:peptidylprolyl isomerase [Cyclobacteriaceae bacterium]